MMNSVSTEGAEERLRRRFETWDVILRAYAWQRHLQVNVIELDPVLIPGIMIPYRIARRV